MSRINKFVLTVSLLIFIMISAVACGIYTHLRDLHSNGERTGAWPETVRY